MKKITFCAKIVGLVLGMTSFALAAKVTRDFVYDSHEKRDLFSPLVTKSGIVLPEADTEEETGSINLEGIIWDPLGKSVAVINKKVLREQDRIRGFQLLKIKQSSVIMQKEGKVFEINLKKREEGTNAVR